METAGVSTQVDYLHERVYYRKDIEMKVIMTQTVDRIGTVGQVLNVKDGYARNYLLPQKLAIVATKDTLKRVESLKADEKKRADQKNEEYRKLVAQIATLEATFARRAEDDGKLFGSVSENDIAQFLSEQGISCGKTHIMLDKHIKTTGSFEVPIVFTHDISGILKVNVVPGE